MKLLPLLLALLSACASAPRARLPLLVDRPLRVEGFSGGSVELSNLGPGQLGYEYRDAVGTLSQGELGVGERLQLDLTGVRELRVECRKGAQSEASLSMHGAGELRVVPLPKL